VSLYEIHVPAGAEPADEWAVWKEFAMRQARWTRDRAVFEMTYYMDAAIESLGLVKASAEETTALMKQLTPHLRVIGQGDEE
jgi:hypothetical protein